MSQQFIPSSVDQIDVEIKPVVIGNRVGQLPVEIHISMATLNKNTGTLILQNMNFGWVLIVNLDNDVLGAFNLPTPVTYKLCVLSSFNLFIMKCFTT